MPQETKLKQLMESEFWTVIKYTGVVVGVVLFIIKPQFEIDKSVALIQKDIETIRTNELRHIQDNVQKEDERNDKQDVQLDEIQKSINQILVELKTKY